MRKLMFAALAASALAALSTSPADASGGCGIYRHRTWAGYCRPNGWGGGYYRAPGYYGGPGWRYRRWRRNHPYAY